MPTSIPWCDETNNTGRGCTRVSDGCFGCYIPGTWPLRRDGMRFDKPGIGGTTGVVKQPSGLVRPFGLRPGLRVFLNSITDTLHPAYEDDWVARVFAMTGLAEHLTWLAPTKRVPRLRRLFNDDRFVARVQAAAGELVELPHVRKLINRGVISGRLQWPLPNLWPAASVEDQAAADRRTPALCGVPVAESAFRWLSCEPLIGPTTVDRWLGPDGVGWLVIGGESGPRKSGAVRRMDHGWAQALRDQGRDAGVAVFMKQTGTVRANELGLTDPKGEDPDEWPEEWDWPREFPTARAAAGHNHGHGDDHGHDQVGATR